MGGVGPKPFIPYKYMPGPAEVNVKPPATLIRKKMRVAHNEHTVKLAPRLASAYAQSQHQPTINLRSQLKKSPWRYEAGTCDAPRQPKLR